MNIASKHASGGRMVKWKGRVASIAPALASVSVVALMSTGALADTVIDTIETSPQLISIDDNVSITADGGVSVNNGASDAYLIDIEVPFDAPYTGTVTNDGTIEAIQTSATSLVGITIGSELAGNIVNNGDISLSVLSNSNTEQSATGIWINGDLSGGITNSASGVIDVQVVSANDSASAYGIYVTGDVTDTGEISNSGTISAEANNMETESSASAYGIYIDGSVAGAITNTSTGVIEASAHSASSEASAYGIYVGSGVTETGSIANAGSISATAESDTNDATAYGIYVNGALDGSIDNTGSIDVYAESDTDTASAYGIYVSSDVNGSINNAGTITVEALNMTDSAAFAHGIYVDGALNGDLTNSGTIDVLAQSVTTDVYAYGVYVNGDVSGSLTNTATGVISAHTKNGDSLASAYGIYVDGGVADGGAILNAGQIEAVAESASSSAFAFGIYVGGDVAGSVTNTATGVITATATGREDPVSAAGIYVGTVSGTIDNAGSIVASVEGLETNPATAFGIETGSVSSTGVIRNSGTIEASTYADISAESYGIYVNDDMNGLIDNSGTISVDLITEDHGTAYGIYVSDVLNGDITNSGTVEVTASSNSDTVYAYGIYASSIGSEGSIDNSGEITVSATNTESSAIAYGVYVQSAVDGTISNSGTIDVSATAGTDDDETAAAAFGIHVGGNLNGTLENSGSILVDANNPADDASDTNATAFGIYVGDTVNGEINNAGLIDITATSDSDNASAYGIFAAHVSGDGSVHNSGEIYALANGNEYDAGVYLNDFRGYFENTGKIVAEDAIHLDGEDGYAVLGSGGFLEGNIELYGNPSLDVQGDRGMSVHWTANDHNTGSGTNDTNPYFDNVNVFTRNLTGSAPEFATFDASGVVANRQAGADASFAGLGALVSNTAKSTAPSVQVTSGFTGEGAFKPFVMASGSSMTYAGSEFTMDQKVQSHSIAVGGSKQSDSGLSFGVAAGASSADTTVTGRWNTASESSVSGAFGGVSVAKAIGSVTISGGLTAGTLGFDNTRYVNDNLVDGGVTEQTASYDSNYIGTEIGLSGRFQVGEGLALLPSATLRYASHSVSGYTETGDDSAAEVASNRFGVAEGELGLTLEKTMDAGVLSIGISEVTRSFSGDTAVGVMMIDDEHSVDASAPNSSATKLSIGFNAGNVGSAQFNVGAETILGSSGASGSKIGGSISFSF